MPHPTQLLPNEAYFSGLSPTTDADASALESIFTEFRRPIVRAVTASGGSDADGSVFFRTGLIEAARAGRAPEGIPFFFFLKSLSLAHFRDWRTERDQPVPAESIATGLEEGAEDFSFDLPAVDALRDTRYRIFAWKQFLQLDRPCRDMLEIAVGEQKSTAELADLLRQPEVNTETRVKDCMARYQASLHSRSDSPIRSEGVATDLPDWVADALRDRAGLALWQKLQPLEDKYASGAIPPPRSKAQGKTARNLFVLLLVITFGIWGYRYFTRSATPAEVYADNFTPPASLLADMASRYALASTDTTAGPAPERPEQCQILFAEADSAYQAKNYEMAQDPLLLMVLDSAAEMQPCQSDAWFYLGILQLLQNEPGEAIQCFAKIENLEYFGEDIYWYQALALVKIATKNSSKRETARRAAQRALENTRDPERQAQAQKMLDKLSE